MDRLTIFIPLRFGIIIHRTRFFSRSAGERLLKAECAVLQKIFQAVLGNGIAVRIGGFAIYQLDPFLLINARFHPAVLQLPPKGIIHGHTAGKL